MAAAAEPRPLSWDLHLLAAALAVPAVDPRLARQVRRYCQLPNPQAAAQLLLTAREQFLLANAKAGPKG